MVYGWVAEMCISEIGMKGCNLLSVIFNRLGATSCFPLQKQSDGTGGVWTLERIDLTANC